MPLADNAVNHKNGFPVIEIRTPGEILKSDENGKYKI
jgi:hypothetical protein